MAFRQWLLYKAMGATKRDIKARLSQHGTDFQTIEKALQGALRGRKNALLFNKLFYMGKRYPQGISLEEQSLGGVPCQIVTPDSHEERVILYIHGGAFIYPLLRMHMIYAAHLAVHTNAKIYLPEYRLAPEHPFPAGLEDVMTSYKSILETGTKPRKIVLMGDSAGGNLILALLHKLKTDGLPLPAAAIPISPSIDGTTQGESFKTKEDIDPLFVTDYVHYVYNLYTQGHDLKDPLVSPLFGDLQGFPPLLILVGDHEILLDDSTQLDRQAKNAGVDVTLHIEDIMFHDYPLFYDDIEQARSAMGLVVSFIDKHVG